MQWAREYKIQLWLLIIASLVSWQSAQALPAYARQTGQPCTSCHVGGLGPQLTPFGQNFKIGGYTMGSGNSSWTLPLSGMLVATYEHTKKDLPVNPGPHDSTNNNVNLQEASLFLAGALTDHIGSFSQVTYSDVDHLVALDNVDIRYADRTELFGANTTYGISLNNNPTLQDPWNTTPAWRFPYTSSALAPTPGAATLINGSLEHQVVGMSAYGYWNNNIYAELGGYRSLSADFIDDTNNTDEAGRIAGIAPYWRFAYSTTLFNQPAMIGLFGLNAALHPDRNNGAKNHYSDLGVDASYQYPISEEHLITFNGSYVHEKQKLDYSFINGDSSRDSLHLTEVNLNASYYFQNTYGLTLGYFNTKGSSDNTLYSPNPLDGNRTGNPNSAGYTLQADWTPFAKDNSWGNSWANVRVGAQYVDYSRFNGSSNDYDGNGRSAKDNNTFYLFVWTAF